MSRGEDLCDEILEMLESVPEAGADFAVSVENKVLSMKEWMETHNGRATELMLKSLENMKRGVEKWL